MITGNGFIHFVQNDNMESMRGKTKIMVKYRHHNPSAHQERKKIRNSKSEIRNKYKLPNI